MAPSDLLPPTMLHLLLFHHLQVALSNSNPSNGLIHWGQSPSWSNHVLKAHLWTLLHWEPSLQNMISGRIFQIQTTLTNYQQNLIILNTVFQTIFEVPHIPTMCVCNSNGVKITFIPFLFRYITQISHIHPCFEAKQRHFNPSALK